jgi:threonine/homoserine/homoserine lactone efflux protein
MLGQAIGDFLPAAVGVALSPVPIVAVILMLGTPRARTNGPAFALGWVVGLAAVSVTVLLLAGGSDDPDSGTSTGVAVAELAFGLLLLWVAVKYWRGRPEPGTEAQMPGWVKAIDSFTPVRSFAVGIVLSAANPKNLALSLSAGASVAQAGLPAGEDVVAIAVFVVLGSLTVAGSVVAYLVAGDRAGPVLERAKEFMAANSAVIMAVVCLVLAAKLIGSAIGGLTD